MNALPVINRELRAEARHAFTYWLRVLGAGAVAGMAAFFVLLHGIRAEQGGQLFQQLHGTLHLAIWILVPLLTADCISRERREGTLGLLFLTPLKAHDIVVAKSLAHGLRAATLLMAVLPVITLPLLMGGVSWQQAVSSLLVNAGAIALALAAGLLASASSKSWVRSLILAFCLATTFAFVFCAALGMLFEMNHSPGRGWQQPLLAQGLQLAIGINPGFFVSTFYYRAGFAGIPGVSAGPMFQAVLIAAAVSFALCLGALLLAVLAAAVFTARDRHVRPPHPLLIWLQQRLCTPVVMRGLLRGWMKHSLNRNPIGWLEQRTWSGRLVIWGWLAVMISLYSLLLTDASYFTRSLGAVHSGMGWVLLGSMALNASTSFRRERETRVLELMLVSPLSEKQIIFGRLRGLWGQFLPSMALLLSGWIYLSVALNSLGDNLSAIIFFAMSFAGLPVVGFYFSLVSRNFLTALVWTALVGMVMPATVANVFGLMVRLARSAGVPSPAGFDWLLNPALIQLGLAVLLCWHLHQRLVQRRFATEST